MQNDEDWTTASHCPQQYPQHPTIEFKRLWAILFSICPYIPSPLSAPHKETQGFEVIFPNETNFSFGLLHCEIKCWLHTKAVLSSFVPQIWGSLTSKNLEKNPALVHTKNSYSQMKDAVKMHTGLIDAHVQHNSVTKLHVLICIFSAMMFKLHCNLARVGKGYRWVNSHLISF